MISVKPSQTYKLIREYGGIAWKDNYLHAVLKYKDSLFHDRPVYLIDPLTGDEESIDEFRLSETDTDDQESIIECFDISAGTWRALLTLSPVIPNYESDLGIHYRVSDLTQVRAWELNGSRAGTIRVAASDIYINTGEQSPYNGVFPGFADRYSVGAHDTFVVDTNGRLVCWRSGKYWKAISDTALPVRTDPLWKGNYMLTPIPGLIPKSIDNDRVVGITLDGGIYWIDIDNWDSIENKAFSYLYKSFFAQYCSNLQDLCVDPITDTLWILKDHDLIRFDLQEFDDQRPLSNEARAIVALNPPENLPHGNDVEMEFRLLDMWGVRTVKQTSVEIMATATTDQLEFYGKIGYRNGSQWEEAQRATVSTSDGIVRVKYHNTLSEIPTVGPETIIARVL